MLVDHHFFSVFHGNLFKKMSGTFEDAWVHISCVVGLEDVQLLNSAFCGFCEVVAHFMLKSDFDRYPKMTKNNICSLRPEG